MLRIRPEQMMAFETHRVDDFKQRLLIYLKLTRNLSEIVLTAEEIDRAIAAARSFSLDSEKHVADFIEITCGSFGGLPPASALPKQALAILTSYGMDPDVKLERFRAWAAEATEVEA